MKPKTLSERIRLGQCIAQAILPANRADNRPVHPGMSRGLKESFIGESVCTY